MRKYGQHFLINSRVIDGIIAAIPPQTRSVLEIGPGRGALTEKLGQKNFPHFMAVEIDPDMQAYLQTHFPALAGHIVLADFVQIGEDALPKEPTFVVSNLPYVAAADILDKLLSWPYFNGAVLMFQKEQAQRILARAGEDGYGPLSILTQVRARPQLLLKVGKACFNPPPKVESAVLTFAPKKWDVAPQAYAAFARLVRAVFLHRRKTLFNALLLSGYAREKIAAVFAALALPATVRAEQVDVHTYQQLANQLAK